MAQEVKLTFRVSDDGTMAVFDKAGTKLREIKGDAERASSSFSRFGAGIVTANQALDLFSRVADVTTRVVGSLVAKIQEIDNIGETAKRVGLTATELSSLRLAATQGGVSLEQLARQSQFLSRQIVAAQDATGKQAALFRELGVDTSRGLIPTLVQLGKAFDQLPEGPEKTATAIALMGRDGTAALNVLNASLGDSIALNEELGQTISAQVAIEAGRAADAFDEMTAAIGGFGQMVAAAAAPALGKFADLIAATATEARRFFNEFGEGSQTPRTVYDEDSGWTASTGSIPKTAPDLGPNDGPQLPPNVGRIRAILSGTAGSPAGGGGGGARAPRARAVDASRELAQQTETLDRQLEAREQAMVDILDAQVTLREEAVRAAEQHPRTAQASGASAAEQLALAARIDEAERAKLMTLREQLETQLLMQELPPTAENVGAVAQLQAELQIVNQRLAEAPRHAAELTRELERGNAFAINLGSSLNSALQRAVDGVLNSGGEFKIGKVLEDMIRTLASEIVGNVLEETVGNIDFGGLLGLGGNSLSSIVGSGISAGSSAITPGLSSTITGPPTAATAAGSASGGAAGAGLAGSVGVLGAAGIGAGVAAAGVMASSLLGISGGLDAVKDSISLKNTISEKDLRDGSGLWSAGSIAAMVVVPILGQFYALIGGILEAAGIFKPPTRGTQLKKGLADILNEAGVPVQRDINIGDRSGVRTVGIEAAPTFALRDEWVRRGFRPQDVGAIEGQGSLNQQRLLPGILDNPELDPLRFGAAAGLAGVLAAGGRDIPVLADTFVNNSALLNQSVEEVRRQLLKVADSMGYDLVSSLEELDQKFDKQRMTMEQLNVATNGVVDLFRDQLPQGVTFAQAQAIIARRTSANGIDAGGVEGDLRRFSAADGLRDQVRDIRYGEMNNRRKEQELRARLVRIDADIAAAQTDRERERLLQERAQVGADFVSLAQSRYGEGSSARRRGVAYGASIIEDTANKLEQFPGEVVDATKEQTTATQENTNAAMANTRAVTELAARLAQGVNARLDIEFSGDDEAVPALMATIKKELAAFIRSPEFRAAARDASKQA